MFCTEDSERSKLITPVSERFRYTDDSCLLSQLKFLVSADKTPFSISLERKPDLIIGIWYKMNRFSRISNPKVNKEKFSEILPWYFIFLENNLVNTNI